MKNNGKEKGKIFPTNSVIFFSLPWNDNITLVEALLHSAAWPWLSQTAAHTQPVSAVITPLSSRQWGVQSSLMGERGRTQSLAHGQEQQKSSDWLQCTIGKEDCWELLETMGDVVPKGWPLSSQVLVGTTNPGWRGTAEGGKEKRSLELRAVSQGKCEVTPGMCCWVWEAASHDSSLWSQRDWAATFAQRSELLDKSSKLEERGITCSIRDCHHRALSCHQCHLFQMSESGRMPNRLHSASP